MIRRYPDEAAILTQKTVVDANGMEGHDETQEDCELIVKGRYESRDSFIGNYTGKFFMPWVDACRYAMDWQKLKLGSREFEIVKYSHHQTHTELWLR